MLLAHSAAPRTAALMHAHIVLSLLAGIRTEDVSRRLLAAFDLRVLAWPASWPTTLRVSRMVVLIGHRSAITQTTHSAPTPSLPWTGHQLRHPRAQQRLPAQSSHSLPGATQHQLAGRDDHA